MWKVMAADDESYIREALKNLISWEKMDCTLVCVCASGAQLLERVREEQPDIVITDIRMPGVDGLGVCKALYETCPETQVILLSAYSEFDYARSAIQYDVCGYVLKIAVLEELPAAVEKAVRNLKRKAQEPEARRQDDAQEEEMDSLYFRMQKYIEDNLGRKITLDEIAEELHANRSYLSRLYKSRSGVNLFDDILARRIELAKEYMRTTDKKMYEISHAVGFDDTGYFSRAFKKLVGVSPREYRNEQKSRKES